MAIKNKHQYDKLRSLGYGAKRAEKIVEWSYKHGHYKNGRKKPGSRSKYT